MYSKWLIDISHSCSKQSNIQTEAMYISWSICVFVSSFEKIHLFTFLKSIFPISLRQIWKSNQKLQALLRWKALCWGETLWVHPRSGDWWLDYSLYWNQGSRVHCQDDDKPNLWAHRIHNLKQRASIQTAHGSPERDTWWERGDRPGWGVREKGKLFSTTLSWGGRSLAEHPSAWKSPVLTVLSEGNAVFLMSGMWGWALHTLLVWLKYARYIFVSDCVPLKKSSSSALKYIGKWPSN